LPDDAWQKILDFEGRFSNDQNDPGGATFLGIARNRNPQWPGWHFVDLAMRDGLFLPNADNMSALTRMAREFYAEKWELMQGPKFLNQQLAVYVFDSAVNVGARRAQQWLQVALNALNNGARLWKDVTVDGHIGPATLAAEEAAARSDRRGTVLFAVRVLRAGFYLNLVDASPTRWERYCAGWPRRAAV